MNNNVVAVATGPIFLKGTELTTDCYITKKLAPSEVDYFCLADRCVRVKCANDGTLQCKKRALFSKIL